MSDSYMKELLRISTAQICQTIGYNATQAASLELLQDVLDKFLKEFARDLHRQVEHYNRTEASLNDVTLTLSSINVNINELMDYINNVEPVPFIVDVPKFPAQKVSHLNFLKSDSKETLTRPTHVHDHLPPMLPPDIKLCPSDVNVSMNNLALSISGNEADVQRHDKSYVNLNSDTTNNLETNGKTPGINNPNSIKLQTLSKSASVYLEDGTRRSVNSVREVSSVVMTTNGNISPSIEGKIPESIIPDIIEELIGLDAPPSPPPPPPPPPPTTPSATCLPKSITIETTTPTTPSVGQSSLKMNSRAVCNIDNVKSNLISGNFTNKGKVHLHKTNDRISSSTLKKFGKQQDFSSSFMPNKNEKLYNNMTRSPNKKIHLISHNGTTSGGGSGVQINQHSSASTQASFANMLLKKAKKQKVITPPGPYHMSGNVIAGYKNEQQQLIEKKTERLLDVSEKAQRKYMKMLQKMAKQGKIPPDILQTLLNADSKLKTSISPAIVATMPPGPEKLQLEKLMRKQEKQRQKLLKQQEGQRIAKNKLASVEPMVLGHLSVPHFSQQQQQQSTSLLMRSISSGTDLSQPSAGGSTELMGKHHLENMATHTSTFKTTSLTSQTSPKQVSLNSTSAAGGGENGFHAPKNSTQCFNLIADGNSAVPTIAQQQQQQQFNLPNYSDPKTSMQLKLSNEPDRQKLNIFKKISKQKNLKGSSPIGDNISNTPTPLIHLPSGTTITPAPPEPSLLSSSVDHMITASALHGSDVEVMNNNNFKNADVISGSGNGNIYNVNVINNGKVNSTVLNSNKPNDLSMFNKVFGEKAPENTTNSTTTSMVNVISSKASAISGGNSVNTVDYCNIDAVNKPKKRGRKPGSKNAPKVPGIFPVTTNSALLKRNKKLKLDAANVFPGNFPNAMVNPLVNPTAAAAAVAANAMLQNAAAGHVFDNNFPNFGMFSLEEKQLQHQIMAVAASKERNKERKKSKIVKNVSDEIRLGGNGTLLNNSGGMCNSPTESGGYSKHSKVPTTEEVQTINKKLMRMDAMLKSMPSSAHNANELNINNLIAGQQHLSSLPTFIDGKSPMVSPTLPLKTGNAAAVKRLSLPSSSDINMPSVVGGANGGLSPFMLANRPGFPNLPPNMLSMLQFPFPPRPGLIPTPGLFPTPSGGLTNFPNQAKILPNFLPFPNLKQTSSTPESVDLTIEGSNNNKNSENNHPILSNDRMYCNVAPLVPEYLKLTSPEKFPTVSDKSTDQNVVHLNSQSDNNVCDDLPKTPRSRSYQQQEKKVIELPQTPESVCDTLNNTIPTTPGSGISLHTFEQLMKKNDSCIELIPLNKQTPGHNHYQEQPHNVSSQAFGALGKCSNLGVDFNIHNKKGGVGTVKATSINRPTLPITLNADEPIEVSDDSDEALTLAPETITKNLAIKSGIGITNMLPVPSPILGNNQQLFNTLDYALTRNKGSVPTTLKTPQVESDLNIKELKKLKKQVRKTPMAFSNSGSVGGSIPANVGASASNNTLCFINTEKPIENISVGGTTSSGGVGKLAGGADLIPLSSTGMAYSAKNIPFNSLTGNMPTSFGSQNSVIGTVGNVSGFNNVTITPANPSGTMMAMGSGSVNSFDLQKKRKEHKKLKKLKEIKEGKIKKKKDKKDKMKNKDKSEKYLMELQVHQQQEHQQKSLISQLPLSITSPTKDRERHRDASDNALGVIANSGNKVLLKEKDQFKKHKKDKKKDKQRLAFDGGNSGSDIVNLGKDCTTAVMTDIVKSKIKSPSTSAVIKTNELDTTNTALSSNNSNNNSSNNSINNNNSGAVIVPKLTLKLGATVQSPPCLDDTVTFSFKQQQQQHEASHVAASIRETETREPSPELARISPLVTRPPKQKLNTGGELTSSSTPIVVGPVVTTTTTTTNKSANNSSNSESAINEMHKTQSQSKISMLIPPPSPWAAGGTISASSVLLPHQLLQTSKTHDITGASNCTNLSNSTIDISNRHSNNASTTNNNERQSPIALISETSRPSSYIDAEGNRVWICPACGKVDDGSPMIGCDGCDAWYHWICVGIYVAPKDNEDWFCRVCITKKKGLHGPDKKRKRTKKK